MRGTTERKLGEAEGVKRGSAWVQSAARLTAAMLLLAMAAFGLSGCSFFHDVKTVVHKLAGGGEEKGKGEGGQGGGAGGTETTPPHEGELLDNKVTALRVEEALRKGGAEFAHVEVVGSAEAVTMKGTVPTASDRQRAEEIAKGVHRKMVLKNELKIAK